MMVLAAALVAGLLFCPLLADGRTIPTSGKLRGHTLLQQNEAVVHNRHLLMPEFIASALRADKPTYVTSSGAAIQALGHTEPQHEQGTLTDNVQSSEDMSWEANYRKVADELWKQAMTTDSNEDERTDLADGSQELLGQNSGLYWLENEDFVEDYENHEIEDWDSDEVTAFVKVKIDVRSSQDDHDEMEYDGFGNYDPDEYELAGGIEFQIDNVLGTEGTSVLRQTISMFLKQLVKFVGSTSLVDPEMRVPQSEGPFQDALELEFGGSLNS